MSPLDGLKNVQTRLVHCSVAVAVVLATPFAAAAAEVCSASKTRMEAIDPHIKGEIAALQFTGHPSDMSGLAFKREDGTDITIADFKGKTVLLNLWATWCAPCRTEMPDLDELQADLGGGDFEVVTVSLDRKAPGKARMFFDEIELKHLALYYDKGMALFPALRSRGMAFGMPTTVILDSDGCSLAHMSGPAAWGGDQAKVMIKAAMMAD
ncbi:thiol:disulfide interchange protein TlpA [Cohaesibacter celericrescens]|uniref:TlpA family protein disulfide reductase n=1 Tax=Cohaesibacter celericrescens TaxID=2067669 RepID=A0A2N5XU68_9HYPH|nr:TlpA disulfide reductase family protein [Cohaesibacter celericrescens]PLW78062.1 TlpA family protein disulfide reductase [Cohaesibacter celericrescens]